MSHVQNVLEKLSHYHSYDTEFQQAVFEVFEDIEESYLDNPKYKKFKVLEKLTEPDRIIRFRVEWEDDNHNIQINRAWRVQFNKCLGVYKGGLRFVSDLKVDTLKFLAFEQVFKNALTGLPMGGAKGGSDFNPKNKSENEIRRFCHAFMDELQRHIGENTDVPAGDIGVGGREIGYLYGRYIKLKNEVGGAITGKDPNYFGSCFREEATGYGCIYLLMSALKEHDKEVEGQEVLISGAGNVALHAAEKFLKLGGKVKTLSDSSGTAFFENGLTDEQFKQIKSLKLDERSSFKEISDNKDIDFKFYEEETPWKHSCDIAIPCATQNEMSKSDATELIKNGCYCIVEGANMPLQQSALEVVSKKKIIFLPAKAANAGGVAVSGLEISQNKMRLAWDRSDVEDKLKDIMSDIYGNCIENIKKTDGFYNYKKGANIYSFKTIADAIVSFG